MKGLSIKEIRKEEVNFQKNILEKIKIPVLIINEDNIKELKKYLQNCDFIIDGLLGAGIKGEIKVFLKEVINTINSSKKKIVACDIPSGLSPDEGVALGTAIKADYTITFIAPKRGFFLKPAGKFCGKIFIQVLILDALLIFPMVQTKTANFYLVIVFLTIVSIFFLIHPKVREHFK